MSASLASVILPPGPTTLQISWYSSSCLSGLVATDWHKKLLLQGSWKMSANMFFFTMLLNFYGWKSEKKTLFVCPVKGSEVFGEVDFLRLSQVVEQEGGGVGRSVYTSCHGVQSHHYGELRVLSTMVQQPTKDGAFTTREVLFSLKWSLRMGGMKGLII